MTDIDTDTQHADLERRLRAAAAAVPPRPLPGDAWVRHQRRLAADDRLRGRRVLGVAAAVLLVVALIGAAALLSVGSPGSGMPASGGGGDDFWAPENVLGEPQTVETLTLDGVRTEHDLVLSDTTGKGPSLCDRFTAADASSASGGCTSRQPDADDRSIAFDWLSGTTGSGDIHGIVAAVDARVAKVRIYLSNGDMVLADLRPTGWEDTKMFALTLQDKAAPGVPQRLVAYADAKGTVLQAVDLTDLFGDEWLPAADSCSTGDSTTTVLAGGSQRVRVTAGHVQVFVQPGSTSVRNPCFATDTVLAGQEVQSGTFVFVVAPEVQMVGFTRPDGAPWLERPVGVRGTPWRVAVVRPPDDIPRESSAVAVDDTGQYLDRQEIQRLS